MAAAHISTMLSVPLFEITAEFGLRACGYGYRLHGQSPLSGPLVVVEDSVNTGNSITKVKAKAPRGSLFAAVFVNPPNRGCVDYYGELHSFPHFFSWHFPGSSLVTQAAFDMDGVICEECPPDCDDDGPKYENFLRTVRPFLLPRPHVVPLIVTARMEKYRDLTEDWLRSHGIRWSRIVMGPWGSLEERRARFNAGEFKGEEFRQSGLNFFLESCPVQARAIADYSGKIVICPPSGQVF